MLKNAKYHVLALLTIIIWGTTFVSTKVLLERGISAVEIFFLRFLLAYLLIWFISPKIFFSKNIKDEFLFVLCGFFGGSFYFITENVALGITMTSNVSIILSTTPILTVLLAYLVNRENKITSNLIYGSVIAFLGIVLVVFNGSFILKLNPLGDFLAFLSGLSWSFYSLLLKKMESKYSILFITRKVFFYGLLTLIPAFYFAPLSLDMQHIKEPVILVNLLFLGIVASMLCFITWNISVKKIGVVKATNYIYVVPLVTMITSALVINEKITFLAIVGAFLILAGVYFAERGLKLSLKKN